ncbi:MAG: phospholipid carrier-dependent glycosyltransferase [Dehalococcoidia bacterium]|nr:phospholipid carrier-dependent glycosyltransferase [Dehalococcoidia bacterium]
MSEDRGPRAATFVLLALLAAAVVLRLYGIDWDQGRFFHPDERFLLQFKLPVLKFPSNFEEFLDPAFSPWNPHSFAYGSLPMYLVKASSVLLEQLIDGFTGDDARFAGRALSALADVGTAVMVYVLGRRLFGWRTALLAVAFMTFAVQHIQLSHFATVDVLLTLFVLIALYGCARALDRPSAWTGILMGVGLGMGLATKVSVLPLVFPVVAAHALYVNIALKQGREAIGPGINRSVLSLVVCGAIAIAVFAASSPYALLDFQTFIKDNREQSQMVLRGADLPYTRQYIDTAPYLYHMQQLAVWGLGLPLGVAAWAGLALSGGRAILKRTPADLLLLAWVIPYFGLTGAFPVKFMRYLLPITPILLLLAAHLLVSWFERGRHRDSIMAAAAAPRAIGPFAVRWARGSRLPMAIVVFIGVATVWYGLAFLNIYRQDHPAVRMGRWIAANAPAGATILKEHWEEGVPFLEGHRIVELPMYEPDNAAKLDHLAGNLAAGDYVLFYSNRLYGTVPRLPQRYPMATAYYRNLFGGALGYELVATTSASPSLLGVTWHEDTLSRPQLPAPRGLPPADGMLVLEPGYADESFTAYDHPLTLLFQNKSRMTAPQIRALLEPSLAGGAASSAGALMAEPTREVQQAGGTWAELFQRDSWANRYPLFAWLLAIQIIGIGAFPLAFHLFGSFPDRGWLVAKTLGLLLVTYAVWLAGSLRAVPFSQTAVLGALTGLLVLGAALYLHRRREIDRFVESRWRTLAAGEAVFFAAMFAFYLIRLFNPDLWHPARGGEKPMDFAYFNAVVKSTFFPPYDPWFAGGSLNYYYFGQMLVATLTRLTGVVPSVAYNLAVPALFALLAANVFSVTAALIHITSGWRAPRSTAVRLSEPNRHTTPSAANGVNERWLLGAGGLAVLFVGVLGNLDGAIQVLEGFIKAGKPLLVTNIPGLSGATQALSGWLAVVIRHAPVPAFDYWRSRAMGSMDPTFIDPAVRAPSITITEFPFFTYLFADLHAHLIALPIAVFTLALAAQAAAGALGSGLPIRILRLGMLGLALGALRWTNTWDYPAFLLVACGAILAGERATGRWDGWLLVRTGLSAAFMVAVGTLAFLPFQQNYELFYSGGIGPSPELTPLHLYLRIFGLFLAGLGGFLVYELTQRFRSTGPLRFLALLWRHRIRVLRVVSLQSALNRQNHPGSAAAVVGAVFLALVFVVLTLNGAGTIGLLFVILAAVAVLGITELARPSERGPAYLVALLMAAVAAALSLFVEVAKLEIPGEVQRMNNVFKLYLQVWTFYALSAVFGVWWVLGRHPGAGGTHADAPHPLREVWRWSLVALGCAALVYPVLATPVRIGDRFNTLPPTIDGMAYLSQAVYNDERGKVELKWDNEAIRWIQDHIPGSPVILEANTPLYRWGSRVSIYTGLPTVLGWDWHQSQQRWDYRDRIEARLNDVQRMYTGVDPGQTLALLRRYHVAFIYLGRLERLYYPAGGLSKFDAMQRDGSISLVYSNPQVQIYRVNG